jgi:hypothetical protein
VRAYNGDCGRVFQHEQANLVSEWLEEIEDFMQRIREIPVSPGIHRNAMELFMEVAATAARAAAAMDKKAGQEA